MLSRGTLSVSLVASFVAAIAASAPATVTIVGFDYQDVTVTQVQIPFFLPTGGQVVESRLSINIDWFPGASPFTMAMSFGLYLQGPGGDPEPAQLDFFALDHFAFDGATMSGTLSTAALNGTLYTDEFGQAFGQLTIFDLGGFGFFGTGDLHAEFDVVVPEPASVSLLAIGSAFCLRAAAPPG